MAVCLLSAALWLSAAAAAGDYTLDELAFLNGIGGFGDVGALDVSRKIRTPHSRLGFSLKVIWEDHPRPPSWWSIRLPLPGPAAGYDTFSFDLYVEQTDETAALNVFLYETDDDRWVCWHGKLEAVEPHRWHHICVRRDQMRPWLIGDRTPQWERLAGLALEPSGGKAVFYVDNPRLTGPAGELNIFTAADDGLRPRPQWNFQPSPPPDDGRCYFPFDCARLDRRDLLETPVKLAKLLGHVGAPISGYDERVADKLSYFAAHGIYAPHYSALAAGYSRFITRRGAWAVRFDGITPNRQPFSKLPIHGIHAICQAHPAVLAAARHKIDALIRAGFGAFMVVDYVMPYWGGLWGYHPVFVAACRDALAARDAGLRFRDGDRERVVHFPDYFRMYNGFFPRPADLGLQSWDEFTPPDPRGVADEASRRRLQMFLWLRTYLWLRLADQAGRYMRSRGGDGLWVVPNPEDTYGSPDYVALVRCAGVGNVFAEWFGPIGWAAEAGYASLPYLRRQARRGGTRLSIIQETGAGGHSDPYLDWRVAYAGVYALTAAGSLQDFDNDFIDHAAFDDMANPRRNPREFLRFRDAVAKALAFCAARRDGAGRPDAKVLCIASRPPAFAGGSIFFGLGSDYNLAVGLSRARIVYDLRDSFDLRPADLASYRLVVYSPRAPRPGDLQMLRRWVQTGDRWLVTHSFVPTRRADGFWRMDRTPRLGDGARGALLGLGRIRQTGRRRVTVTAVAPGWQDFTVGETIELPEPLVRASRGRPLVQTDAGPLVSAVRLGRGQVIYLHYAAGKATAVHRLDARVFKCVARAAGLSPYAQADFSVLLQVFQALGGKVVVAWDGARMGKWRWQYKPGIAPMPYRADDVKQPLRIRVENAATLTVFDFFENRAARVQAQDGWLPLALTGRICGLWYVADDSASGRALIAAARHRRLRLAALQFDAAATSP